VDQSHFCSWNFPAKTLVKISLLWVHDMQYAFCSQNWCWARPHCNRHNDCAFYLYTLLVYISSQHTLNGSRVATLREDTDSQSRSIKLPRISNVDLVQFLSGLWTYVTDIVKARVPQRLWKMFGFYVIKHREMGLR